MSKCNFLADKINCILCARGGYDKAKPISLLPLLLFPRGTANYPWANQRGSAGTIPRTGSRFILNCRMHLGRAKMNGEGGGKSASVAP